MLFIFFFCYCFLFFYIINTIKRNLNIKDYGNMFPGHGGMLDRCDSIIFTAPLVVLIGQFLPFLTMK